MSSVNTSVESTSLLLWPLLDGFVSLPLRGGEDSDVDVPDRDEVCVAPDKGL
jgi:hypothetical protein